jgi:hypothetical protein
MHILEKGRDDQFAARLDSLRRLSVGRILLSDLRSTGKPVAPEKRFAAFISRGRMVFMPRFTLSAGLWSVACFGIAAGTFRLLVTHSGGDYALLLLTVSCVTAMAGFGFLLNQVGFSIVLGFVIAFLLLFVFAISNFVFIY